MAEELQQPEKKKTGLFGSMGLLPKILILIAAIVIGLAVLGGLPETIGGIFWLCLQVGFGAFLIAMAIKGIQTYFKPKAISPTQNNKSKLSRLAKQSKPPNVNELIMSGKNMRLRFKIGKIIGLLFIPYIVSVPEKDENGKIIMVEKTNIFGKVELDKERKPVMIPKMQKIPDKDGDWLFVVKSSLLGEERLIRVHHSLCSELANEVYVDAVNFLPSGDFEYPDVQWKSKMSRIMAEHFAETAIEAFFLGLDYTAQAAQAGIRGDPTFNKIIEGATESLSTRNQGLLNNG